MATVSAIAVESDAIPRVHLSANINDAVIGQPQTCCFVVIGRQGLPQSLAAAAKNRSPRPPDKVRPPYQLASYFPPISGLTFHYYKTGY